MREFSFSQSLDSSRIIANTVFRWFFSLIFRQWKPVLDKVMNNIDTWEPRLADKSHDIPDTEIRSCERRTFVHSIKTETLRRRNGKIWWRRKNSRISLLFGRWKYRPLKMRSVGASVNYRQTDWFYCVADTFGSHSFLVWFWVALINTWTVVCGMRLGPDRGITPWNP